MVKFSNKYFDISFEDDVSKITRRIIINELNGDIEIIDIDNVTNLPFNVIKCNIMNIGNIDIYKDKEDDPM